MWCVHIKIGEERSWEYFDRWKEADEYAQAVRENGGQAFVENE